MIGNDKFVRLFGSTPAGDDELLIRIVAEAVREGVAIVLNRPGTKIPMCTLSAVERNRADKKAREQAAQIGDVNWSKRHHLCGLYHALTVKSLTGTDELPEGDPKKVLAKVGTIIRRLTKINDGKSPNIGVELGLSRMLVVDVDTDAEVAGFAADWAKQTSEPLPGMTVRSPGKKDVDGEWVHKNGGHYWFSLPDDVELPAGQGALKDVSNYVMMWHKHQVLVPPSAREEGAYELIGQIEEAQDWQIAKIIHEAEARMKRAASTVLPDGTGDIDTWSFETPWADILEPDGWINTGIPDNCSCDTWTAPGPHGTSKSATAHDIGCSFHDSVTSPPLHVWTYNPPEWLDKAIKQTGSSTLTKLRYLAWRDHGGSQKDLLVAMGFNHAAPVNDLNNWSPDPVRKPVAESKAERPAVARSDDFEGDDGPESPDADTEAEDDEEELDEDERVNEESVFVDSWASIDLGSIDDDPPKAKYLPRSDGIMLLYPGLMHSIHGEPESGKSWIAQCETVRLIKLGERVLFLDFENDVRSVVSRFRALGATKEELKLIDYRNPDTKPDFQGKSWRGLFNAQEGEYSLIVIDGMTDALGLFNLGSNGNDEISTFMRKFRILARRTMAALVIIDHVVKDKSARGRYAIGGIAKMGAIDGAAYVVDVVEPMGKGQRGVLKVFVAKDKGGDVRPHSVGYNSDRLGNMGLFIMDATNAQSDYIMWQFQEPEPEDPFSTKNDAPAGADRNEGLETLILQELSLLAPAGLSSTELAKRLGKRRPPVEQSLTDLMRAELIVRKDGQGKNRSKVEYSVTERGQEEVG
jgi:hypothetical protein